MTPNPYALSDFLTLLDQSDTSQLVIPNFQRRFEWERAKQQRLAASVLCQLPIGAMVLFPGRKDNFAHNRLCLVEPMASEHGNVTYLLDGQQRLATLSSLFADPFDDHRDPTTYGKQDWKAVWQNLYPPLQTRWYLDLSYSKATQTPLGARDADGGALLNLARARSLSSEPKDIAQRIVHQRITKAAGKQEPPPWWHPAYSVQRIRSGRSAVEVRSAIAAAAAKIEAIPLWELARTEQLEEAGIEPLHALTARRLARKLEAELRDLLDIDPVHGAVVQVLGADRPDRPVQLPLDTETDNLTVLLTGRSSDWASQVSRTLEKLVEIGIPTITVRGGDLGRAVTIFENINEGGTPLTAFDLVNAKAVRDHEHLRPLRERVADCLSAEPLDATEVATQLTPEEYGKPVPARELTGVEAAKFPAQPAIIRNQYLNLLSILGHGRGPKKTHGTDKSLTVEYMKKERQLQLTAEQINETTENACNGLIRACLFLQGCVGRVTPERISYGLMFVPLALALLDDELFQTPAVWAKLEYWYWVSLFGGRYREAQNDVCVRDVQDLYSWCVGDVPENPFERFRGRVLREPSYSDQQAFIPEPGDEVRVAKAVEEGILDFILAGRPRDFLPREWDKVMLSAAGARREKKVATASADQTRHSYKMTLAKHHIVPLGSVTTVGESTRELRQRKESLYNSALNLTKISTFANDRISDRTPAGYLSGMEEIVLASHSVPGSGEGIWSATKDDRPLAATPKEEGLREVLVERFGLLKIALDGRLDELEGRAGG